MAESCATCYFFQQDKNKSTIGICRRYPPRFALKPKIKFLLEHKNDVDMFVWSMVDLDKYDWCGEYKENR